MLVRNLKPGSLGFYSEATRGWLIEHDRDRERRQISTLAPLKSLFTMGQSRSVFFFPFPFLPFLNDRVCSGPSKRNLSPQDTDVIELTLTTIYDFDKLLHLLRDRSENLDHSAIRLTWKNNALCMGGPSSAVSICRLSSPGVRDGLHPFYDALPQAEPTTAAPLLLAAALYLLDLNCPFHSLPASRVMRALNRLKLCPGRRHSSLAASRACAMERLRPAGKALDTAHR